MKIYTIINNRLYYFNISNDNIHIEDSYKTPKKDFDVIIDYLKKHYYTKTEVLNKRNKHCLKMEWACHNLCYKLNIKKERTKDVDLNINDKYDILYHLFGWIAWILIK